MRIIRSAGSSGTMVLVVKQSQSLPVAAGDGQNQYQKVT
jgi:hypothetical protein